MPYNINDPVKLKVGVTKTVTVPQGTTVNRLPYDNIDIIWEFDVSESEIEIGNPPDKIGARPFPLPEDTSVTYEAIDPGEVVTKTPPTYRIRLYQRRLL